MRLAQITGKFIFAGLCLAAVCGRATGQTPELKLNEPLERELTSGQTHEYQVTLQAGEFTQVRVEQKGIDVVLSIHSADGRQLAEMDSPNGKQGLETLSFVADTAGTYVVTIDRLEDAGNAESGRYHITLTAKRPSVAEDLKRVAAERQFFAATKVDSTTLEQMQAEIERFEELLQAWRELKDAYVVNFIETRITDLKRFKSRMEEEAKKRALVQQRTEREKANADTPQLTVPISHASGVNSVALSPDGRTLASGSDDETIKLWDVEMGRELKTLRGHVGSVEEVAFSPNGKTLASASDDRTVKLWDIVTGQELRSLEGHRGCVSSVAFLHDGSLLASGSCDGTVKLWDAATGRELNTLKGHTSYVWSVAFSPDGKTLASSSYDRTVRLWNVATGQGIKTLTGKINSVWSVAFSPDGKTLATGSYGDAVKLWDAATGLELRTLHIQRNIDAGPKVFPIIHKEMPIAFSPDGNMLASGFRDKSVKLWDVATGREINTFKGHDSAVQSVAFSSDSKRLASGSYDNTIKLWDVAAGREAKTFKGHTYGLWPGMLSPDGKTLSSAVWNKAIKLWDLATGREPITLKAPPYFGLFDSPFAFTPDGKILASKHSDESVKLWDAVTGREIKTLQGQSSDIKIVLFSPDGKTLVSGDSGGTLKLWAAATGQELKTLKGHTAPISSVAFSPDGRTLASGSSDDNERLEAHVRRRKALMEQFKESNTDGRSAASPSADEKEGLKERQRGPAKLDPPDKTTASDEYDDTVRLWDLATGRELMILRGHPEGVFSVAFSPDGQTLASTGGKAKLWDVTTGDELKYDKMPEWSEEKRDKAFSVPKGGAVRAHAEGNTIVLRNAVNKNEVATLIAVDEDDWAVIDPDGRWDASDGAQKLMYYTLATPEGFEVIEFSQLKERYYEPNLLPKLLGYNREPLKDVAQFKDVLLPPALVPLKPKDAVSTVRQVAIRNRNGGIGRVQVFVNGREYIEDARDKKLRANPNLREYTLSFDLKDAPVIAGQKADVKVVAWNYDEKAKERYKGYISSRGADIFYLPPEEKVEPPTLYAIIGGISDYKGNTLDLGFAAKDAEDFYRAIQVGGKNLFGVERMKLKLLSTGGSGDALLPSKENFRRAFADFAAEARPNDVLFVYLAGHGITLNFGSDTYYYLTQEAATTDKETLSKDTQLLSSSTISSEELTQWHKSVKALKQVLVLDTCAAGALGNELDISRKRDISSDAKRAIADMRTRVGFHVLMGSAADAVSYEDSQYGQGLLTYSLLQGMKGAALQPDGQIDVSRLFNYAANTVPNLARNIGGIQRPEIRVPIGGTSFAFGLIKSDDDKKQIPLALLKPVVLRPNFQNQEKISDNLKLGNMLRDRLREAGYAMTHGRAGVGLVFVDTDEMPDAIIPAGRYVVEGDVVKVTIRLSKNDELVATVAVEGNISDLPGLIEKIFTAINAESQRLNSLSVKNNN